MAKNKDYREQVRTLLKSEPNLTSTEIAKRVGKTLTKNDTKTWGVYVSQQRKALGQPSKQGKGNGKAKKQRSPLDDFQNAHQLVETLGGVENAQKTLQLLNKVSIKDALASIERYAKAVAVADGDASKVLKMLEAMQ